MRAWIVTWEWGGDAAAVADKVAAILPARWGKERVASHVEFLYALTHSTVDELARYARTPKDNPYPAQADQNGWVTCGHNPFLLARPASDVKVERHPSTGLETIQWVNSARWKMVNDRPAEDVPPRAESTTRRIEGPLRSMEIWDREAGCFKSGWGLDETPTSA